MGLIFPTFAGGEIWANLWFLKHWSRLHKDPARPPAPPCKVELSWLFGVRATTRTSCDNCCVQLPAPKLLYTSPNPEIHPFHPTLYPPFYPTIQLESRKCCHLSRLPDSSASTKSKVCLKKMHYNSCTICHQIKFWVQIVEKSPVSLFQTDLQVRLSLLQFIDNIPATTTKYPCNKTLST